MGTAESSYCMHNAVCVLPAVSHDVWVLVRVISLYGYCCES
jgi:hypothetical protein